MSRRDHAKYFKEVIGEEYDLRGHMDATVMEYFEGLTYKKDSRGITFRNKKQTIVAHFIPQTNQFIIHDGVITDLSNVFEEEYDMTVAQIRSFLNNDFKLYDFTEKLLRQYV